MVNKKTYLKYKSYPVEFGTSTPYYTDPSTGTAIPGIGGPTGVDWDSSTFTMTAGGSGVTDFTTLFDVGGLVINAVFNEVWATVVSVTATDVVFDGDLSGNYNGKFLESDFAQWTDPDEAFKLVLNSSAWADASNIVEVGAWYPGSGSYISSTHTANVVRRDGHTLTLDRPLALTDYVTDFLSLWQGEWMGATAESLLAIGFWGGDGYYYDTWFEFANNAEENGWFEYWDSYAPSNSNQTEAQLYAKIDKQIEQFARVLGSAYPETDWYIGTPRLGERLY